MELNYDLKKIFLLTANPMIMENVLILNDRPLCEARRAHRQRRFLGPCARCGEYDGQDVGVSARFR